MKRANGMGSVYKVGGNRRKPYVAMITKGWDENGKQIKSSLGYFKTKTEANRELMKYNLNPDLANNATVEQIYDLWSEYHFPNLSESGVANYRASWNRFNKLKNLKIRDVRSINIEQVLKDYSHLSTSSLRKMRTLMNQLFNFAIKNGYAEINYASSDFIKVLSKDKKEVEMFTDEEVLKLWENIDKEWVDSILFMIYTGLRVSEMTTLPKSKINLDQGYFQYGKKTEAGKNSITPIFEPLLPLVEKRMQMDGDLLFSKFGREITTDHYRRQIYYPLLKKLGLSRCTPHSCRHKFATLLNKYVSNKDYIKNLMRHTDYSLTSNNYTHNEIVELSNAINNIEI